MPNESQFVTSHCQVCNGHIEFDSSDFGDGEIRKVECPHCKIETILFVPDKKSPENKSGPVIGESKVAEQKTAKPKLRACPTCSSSISKNARFCVHCGERFPAEESGWLIAMFAIVIFLTGGAFFCRWISEQRGNHNAAIIFAGERVLWINFNGSFSFDQWNREGI